MILINEWLPNPVGNDASGEFIELFNSGDASADLSGWVLATKGSKKKIKISGSVPPGGFLVVDRKREKFVLKNSDEGIALYDSGGNLADESSFIGAAPSGKSLGRMSAAAGFASEQETASPGRARETIQRFAWGEPTPGAINNVLISNAVATMDVPIGVPLNRQTLGTPGIAAAMFATAVLLTGLILYSIKVNEDLSDLFFPRDESLGS